MIFGLFRRHTSKLVFGLMFTIILLLALDTSIARLYALIYGTIFVGNNVGIPTEWNTFGFTLITAFCLVGQFIILKAVTERTKEMRTKGSLHLAIVQKLVYVVVSGLIAIFIFMVLQMEFTSSFNLSLLATFVGLSYTLGAIMMGYLASRFFLWFKVNKNSVVLAYTLASLMLFINITFTLVYVLYLLTDQPEIMRPHSGHISAAIFEDSILYQGYVISSILSFVMTWIATQLLMRHHSTRLGTIKVLACCRCPPSIFFDPIRAIIP